MRIRSFTHEPEAVEEFVQVAWDLRADDPRWVPPIRASLHAELSETNPFFRHGRIRNFMAVREGRAVGRCSAIVDPRLTAGGAPAGMVGHFEVERDYDTAAALLDHALGWLRDEGAREAWGPFDFSIFNRYRFQTAGFDREPFMGEPDNRHEYPEYFMRYGFEVKERYTAWDLDEEQVVAVQERAEEAADRTATTELGYTYRTLDPDRLEEEMHALYAMAVECFTEHPGYAPVTWEEFAFWNQGSSLLMDPAIILFFMSPDGEVAGASYKYPDWAPLLKRMDGRVDPETLSAHRDAVTIDRAVYHTDMVWPAHRRKGLIHGSFARFIQAARDQGYTRAVTGLARAGHPIWGKVLEVADEVRAYALYRIPLGGSRA